MKERYIKGAASVWPEDIEQEPQIVYFVPPKKRKYEARWILFWADDTGINIGEQAKMQKPLTQTEYRIRDWLICYMGIGNYVYVNQSEIARELNIAQPNVSTAIKRLCELQILIRGPKNGRSNTYMINPACCFSGGIGNGIKARDDAKKSGKILPFKKLHKDL